MDVLDKVCVAVEAWAIEERNDELYRRGLTTSALRALNEYIDDRNQDALQGAIYLSAIAVGCSPLTCPARSEAVAICHLVFYHKYLLRRDPRDLQFALRALFEDVKLYSPNDEGLVGPYASISDIYLERYNRWRRDEDLQKAATYGGKAVQLFSPDINKGAYSLYHRGLALMRGYESDGKERTLQKAITQAGGAVTASHFTGQIRPYYMQVYANMLSVRAGRVYGSHGDIQAALHFAKRAYECANDHQLPNATYTRDLSNRYYQRYKRMTKSLWDLDKAIELMRTLSTSELRLNGSSLALELLDRYRDFGDSAAAAEAVKFSRLAVQGFAENGNSVNRAKAENIATCCLEALYEQNHQADILEEGLVHARRALTFMPARHGLRDEYLEVLCRLTNLKESELWVYRRASTVRNGLINPRPQPQNLCRNCFQLPQDLFKPGSAITCPLFTGEGVLVQIQASIDSGCHLCSLIKDAINPIVSTSHSIQEACEKSTELLLRAGDAPSEHDVWSFPWTSWLTVELGAQVAGQLRILNKLESETALVMPWEPIHVEKQIFTTSQISVMNRWLDECISNHSCNQHLVSYIDFELPSRLIKIDFDGTNYIAKLVETTAWSRPADAPIPSYVALSHCWGRNPEEIPQTTKENIQARKRSIDFNALSKTFQEAIRITQALNIAYLWIDSLCIIQHDEEDWGREASNMHLIYEWAMVTLVASASTDGNAGLWRPRNSNSLTRLNTCQIRSPGPKGTSSVTVYPHLTPWENAVTAGPISKRGWCFQERQLSRRIIHFTELRILWECRSCISSEDAKEMQDRPVDLDRSMASIGRLWDTREAQKAMNSMLGQPLGTDMPLRQMYFASKWCQVVEEYSRRRLTYSRDKLSALSGIARTIWDFVGKSDDYLAGLWATHLARDLSWFPRIETFTLSRSLPPGEGDPTAPSWSWACFPGPVSYHQIDQFRTDDSPEGVAAPVGRWESSPFKLVSAQIAPESLDLFGRVKSGARIVVASVVADVAISEAYYLPRFCPQNPELKCYSMFKVPGFSGIRLTGERAAVYDPQEAIRHGYVCFDINPTDLHLTSFRCLRLGKGVSRLDQGISLTTLGEKVDTGIVLVKIEGTEEYKRVGIFEIGPSNAEWSSKRYYQELAIL